MTKIPPGSLFESIPGGIFALNMGSFESNFISWFVGEQFYCSRGTLRCHKAFLEERSSSPTMHLVKAI